MKSALRLRGLVWTISSRRAQSKAPIIAILAAWPGAGTRRSAPFLAQTTAGEGCVSASDSSPKRQHDVAGRGLRFQQLTAQTGAVNGIGILTAFQRVPRPPPAKAPFFLRST